MPVFFCGWVPKNTVKPVVFDVFSNASQRFQDPPVTAQDAPKTPSSRPKTFPSRPKPSEDWHKTRPRRLQVPPRPSQDAPCRLQDCPKTPPRPTYFGISLRDITPPAVLVLFWSVLGPHFGVFCYWKLVQIAPASVEEGRATFLYTGRCNLACFRALSEHAISARYFA